MIPKRTRNIAIMQLILKERQARVGTDIIVSVAVDEFGVNHKSTIQQLTKILHDAEEVA